MMTGTLAVRKTIVLGLGSTGLKVCEQLAEHLSWQFGGFERACWVRLLVLETAQPTSPLGDRVLWAGMARDEYLPYLNSPRTTGAEFGFYDWHDSPTLRDIDNPSDGAGNCRMLGRLCLFHPRNYENLRRRVTADLSELQSLTPQRIADSLGEPGLSVKIDEGGTMVYIVGSLCGGTGSGGAADLGYLIDVWSHNSARRQAIFTLPHPTLQHSLAARYKKNAFYALKELNHFQLSDTMWSQKLPGSAEPFVHRSRPYDILRVVMPSGGGDTDVRGLNSMIAQYLAAAVGPAGLEIAASDVDAIGQMIGAESIGFMRPLFSTVGVAALEYPGEHIQRAATTRLLAAAFERWGTHTSDPAALGRSAPLLDGFDFERTLQRLLAGVEGFTLAPLQALGRAAADGNAPRVEQARRQLRDAEELLGAVEPPSEAGQPQNLIQLLLSNHQALLQAFARDVDRFVEQKLLDLDGGPGFLAAALRGTVTTLQAWDASTRDLGPAARQDADSLRSLVDRQFEEVEKVESALLVWNRKEKLREGWEELMSQLQAYLQVEIRAQALAHLQRRDLLATLTDHATRTSTLMAQRLEQIHAAFQQEAGELARSWMERASQTPGVNGKVYFEPEPPAAPGTVTREYYQLLRATRWPDEPPGGWDDELKESAACREVIRAMAELKLELTRPEGQGAFDRRAGAASAREAIPAALRVAAEHRARTFFEPLRDMAHLADRASQADIDTVIQASEPRLPVAAAQVSEQLTGVRGSAPMFSYLAFMGMGPNPDTPRPAIEQLERRVRNSIQLRRGGITDSKDPYRLLLVREKHGFTFGQMEGVVKATRYDNHALQAAESCADFKYWHTRRDVDWVDPLVPPAQVEGTEEAWLLALLLGRSADPSLSWLPATAGEIPPEGWYQLVSGAFYVYFADGLDASERGAMLPLSFNTAVAKLLSADYQLLRRTLGMRFSAYCDRHGVEHAVEVLDLAIRSLVAYGMADLDARKAEKILRRAYRRNESLTRAFFNLKTLALKNAAEFAHLWRMQGTPVEEETAQSYPSDGYYCPRCHYLLGGSLDKLLEDRFLCPRCNSGDRYWP